MARRNGEDRGKGCRCVCCCCFIPITIAFTVIQIVFILNRPVLPDYSVVEAAVMPNYTLSDDGKLTANFTFIVESYNPNKKSIFYGTTRASLYFVSDKNNAEVPVASGALPPLSQPRRTATNLTLNLYAQEAVLDPNVSAVFRPAAAAADMNVTAVFEIKPKIHYGHWSGYSVLATGKWYITYSASKGFEMDSGNW